MITTMTNLRATATEAYLKGEADAYSSENLRTLIEERKTRSSYNQARMQEQGGVIVVIHIRGALLAGIAETEKEIAEATTRWEKRRLTGRLEGLRAALELAVLS